MIAFDAGGRGAPLLVLLHGLGATAAVWTPMLDSVTAQWPGRWIAPDLPGHGGSGTIARYHQADYVGALAPFLREQAAGEPVTLLGHSLGGTLSLALAASGALPVARANVLGDRGELERGDARATGGPRGASAARVWYQGGRARPARQTGRARERGRRATYAARSAARGNGLADRDGPPRVRDRAARGRRDACRRALPPSASRAGRTIRW